MMLSKAIAIAAKAFEGTLDKGGSPYILHCIAVMNMVGTKDSELAQIAVLHDLVEDTDWNFIKLKNEGFSDRVISTLLLLTRVEGHPYDEYIKSLSDNEDAKKVKRADLRHNTDILRMKGLRRKDFERLEKYHKSFMYLSD